jgi:cellulose synthase/poly-beta-1,6-N-acetylglucosamine synthase-like glycosyltransferase
MDALAPPLLAAYAAVLAVFCVYGVHRYWLAWTFLRSGGLRSDAQPEPERFDHLPRVTVQLPMFNERHVAERIIEAACALDYPADRLQIQALDDSTDASGAIARDCCARMAARGHDIEYIHRASREGYKAGALANGLERATGEYIAVFDADFVPPRDALRQAIHHLTDRSVGMVQMRWGHLNRERSLLTRIQAMCLDGHFVIEQAVRARTGRWFNFNGTAGIWRRTCIDDAGGWSHDTLTEDTDLSYRAQLRGWSVRYLPEIVCPAELPPTIGAMLSQQHRWNKGLLQTAIKLLPAILRHRAPWRLKLDALFHLTAPLPYAAMLLLTLLIAPAFMLDLPQTGTGRLALTFGGICLGLGTCAFATFYLVSQRAQGRSILRSLPLIVPLMAIGIGISVMNTRAILEAFIGWRSPFVRTPKYADEDSSATDPGLDRSRRLLPPGTAEAVLTVIMILSVALSVTEPIALVSLPFVLLFGVGYASVALPQLRRSLAPPKRRVMRPEAISVT